MKGKYRSTTLDEGRWTVREKGCGLFGRTYSSVIRMQFEQGYTVFLGY